MKRERTGRFINAQDKFICQFEGVELSMVSTDAS